VIEPTNIDALRPLADPETLAVAQMLVDSTGLMPAGDANRGFVVRVIDGAMERGRLNLNGRVTMADLHAAIEANGGGIVSRQALPGDPEYRGPAAKKPRAARAKKPRAGKS
jgi:hypothetical protein